MIEIWASLAALLWAPPSVATLETMARIVALPVNATRAARPWSDLDGVSGITWQGQPQTGAFGLIRTGTTTLTGLGDVDLLFTGPTAGVTEVSISTSTAFDPKQALGTLTSQFSREVSIEQVRGPCGSDGVTSFTSVFRVSMPGLKPVFVYLESDGGGGGGGIGATTNYSIAGQQKDEWACVS